MLEVLMSLGFIAYRLIFFPTKHADGPDKAVCVTNILPHFATCIPLPLCIKLISIPRQPPFHSGCKPLLGLRLDKVGSKCGNN